MKEGDEMVRGEEIRKAITELSVEELKVYLEETIFDGIKKGSPEEDKIYEIRDEAMDPFIVGYADEKLRPGYHKLMELSEMEAREH